jgi:hypothetical protein
MSVGDRVKVSDSDKVIFRNLQVSEKNEQLFCLGIFMFCIFHGYFNFSNLQTIGKLHGSCYRIFFRIWFLNVGTSTVPYLLVL